VLFEANFNELVDGQVFTAWAWGIAALQDAYDPGRVLKSRALHQGQPRIKFGLYLALEGALELLAAADWFIQIYRPGYRIMILESRHYRADRLQVKVMVKF
jgi:hypothetical protein